MKTTNEKVIKIMIEHEGFETNIDFGGNGLLPAYCKECSGKLDFARVGHETILKCRSCGAEVTW